MSYPIGSVDRRRVIGDQTCDETKSRVPDFSVTGPRGPKEDCDTIVDCE